ncbi:MAG TPA: tetratricopeptide repeat protein [Thermoanaerobaculia bacterium]|jgi:tetratricopeptide (TPR) repeat protein
MAQPASNPKIEELRFRLKTDPKSRLFFPLAEELRKAGQLTEAESVLRSGLTTHPAYLSAWVSLGRVLRDQKKDPEAVEALTTALQVDPGNVVAARLLADAYFALGEKVEAIKKYKLVHALLPADQDLAAIINTLERELGPPPPVAAPDPDPEPEPLAPEPEPARQAFGQTLSPIREEESTAADLFAYEAPAAEAANDEVFTPAANEGDAFSSDAFASEAPAPGDSSRVFDETGGHLLLERRIEEETRDVEPMSAAHDDSPFEEPVNDTYTSAAFAIEAPMGMHVDVAPLGAEVPTPVDELFPEAEDPFPLETPPGAPGQENLTNTLTMADLYVRQGLVAEASHIYENILSRDPENHAVREKLEALTGGNPRVRKIRRLEEWLAKVSRREVRGV